MYKPKAIQKKEEVAKVEVKAEAVEKPVKKIKKEEK